MSVFLFFCAFQTAFAQASGSAPKGPSVFEMLVLPVGFLGIMYFLVIRPQQKRAKEQQNLLSNLKSGDEVITSSGIIGRVKSVADNFVSLEVASNTTIKVLKSSIQSLTKAPTAPSKT